MLGARCGLRRCSLPTAPRLRATLLARSPLASLLRVERRLSAAAIRRRVGVPAGSLAPPAGRRSRLRAGGRGSPGGRSLPAPPLDLGGSSEPRRLHDDRAEKISRVGSPGFAVPRDVTWTVYADWQLAPGGLPH